MNTSHRLFTSESVSMGYPDKVADQISDAVLDRFSEMDRLRLLMAEVADELTNGPISFTDRHRLAARLRQGR